MITRHLPGAAAVSWSDWFGSLAFSLSFAIIDAMRGISGTKTIAEFLSIVQPRSTPTKTPTNFSSFDMTALPLSPFQRGKSVSIIDMSVPGMGFGLPINLSREDTKFQSGLPIHGNRFPPGPPIQAKGIDLILG